VKHQRGLDTAIGEKRTPAQLRQPVAESGHRSSPEDLFSADGGCNAVAVSHRRRAGAKKRLKSRHEDVIVCTATDDRGASAAND
jgi:hypothetical protein